MTSYHLHHSTSCSARQLAGPKVKPWSICSAFLEQTTSMSISPKLLQPWKFYA
ncbi:hypothetical protein LINPERPRIM_LOCUS36620 [Linum perenne]